MHFSVDSSSPIPPGEQLIDQVRFAVAARRLEVGDRLPSVRGLAAQVRVNPNTVGRAWRELEREGVLEARRGAGMFVAVGAPALCRAHRDEELAVRIGRAVAEARSAGFDVAGVLELVTTALRAWDSCESENALSGRALGDRRDQAEQSPRIDKQKKPTASRDN